MNTADIDTTNMIYRNGKKVLVLKGKAKPQIVKEDIIDKYIKD